jgi:hypothetical protein
MPKPYSIDLRGRVIEDVATGASRREAAERYGLSPSVVVIWMQRFEETGSVAAEDAKAGSEALFRVWPVLQDELTERRGCWPDEGGIPADTADGPVGVTAMTGRHVIGDRRVLAVFARPQVHGDPLAPGLLWAGQARWEAVPVVNRRGPRARRGVPLRLTQRRAREVPVDPPGRAESLARWSFLVSFCWLGGR